MAKSFNSYMPDSRPRDTAFDLRSGEKVELHINYAVFHENGQLKATAKSSVAQNAQLFTLTWPREVRRTTAAQSHWRLVITRATTEKINSFCVDTAENFGSSNWGTMKEACSKCREKFSACLMSMSCQEIIFTHESQQSAEEMKDSNQMVDIMNSLLADTEYAFRDIMVDWDVTINPLEHAASDSDSDSDYFAGGSEHKGLAPVQHLAATGSSYSLINSSLMYDGDPPSEGDSSHSGISRLSASYEEPPSPILQVLTLIRSESQKMAKMAADNERRHRVVCHHLEEIKNTLSDFRRRLRQVENGERAERRNYREQTERPHQQPESASSRGEHQQAPHITSSSASALSDDPPPLPPPETHQVPHQRNSPTKDDTKSSSQAHAQHRSKEREPEEDATFQSDFEPDTYETFAGRGEKTTMSGCELENYNLDVAVQRAYEMDAVPPPKAKSYYTVLCLDISKSMEKDGAGEEMLSIVNEFIDGVEDIVNESGVEENIGVVTFGGTSTVIQNVTNDFSLIRNAIDSIQFGGRSPFVQALLVSMAAFVKKAGIISVSGVYDVRPRIIFISDGHATENTEDGDDYPFNKTHVRTALTQLMMGFATKKKYDKIRPVVYVPVGGNADKGLMKSMAQLSKGVYLEPQDIMKLCGYFVVQDTIGKMLAVLKKRTGGDDHDEARINALAKSLMPDLNEEQQVEALTVVKRELATPSERHRNRNTDFEKVHEDTDKVNAGERLPLGTRVVRGPDWKWENQDGHGPGTVICHIDKEDWTWVDWDESGYNRYAYGPDMGYHIWKTEDHPRLIRADGKLKIGMTVEKGPDWEGTMENLQCVKTGVVIRKSRAEKKLMVRWDNGERQVVRYGHKDKYDVVYCDPMEMLREPPLAFASFTDTPTAPHFAPRNEGHRNKNQPEEHLHPHQDFAEGMWQWRDNERWQDYPFETSEAIERQYRKKPQGSCIIVRNGTSRRVMFRRKVEKVVDDGLETPVQRVPVHR